MYRPLRATRGDRVNTDNADDGKWCMISGRRANTSQPKAFIIRQILQGGVHGLDLRTSRALRFVTATRAHLPESKAQRRDE